MKNFENNLIKMGSGIRKEKNERIPRNNVTKTYQETETLMFKKNFFGL